MASRRAMLVPGTVREATRPRGLRGPSAARSRGSGCGGYRLRLAGAALDPAEPGHLLLQRVEPVRGLAGVCVAGPAFPRLGRGDVHIVGRRELDRVLAVGDLVVVEGEAAAHPQPGVIDQHRDRAVVGVVVDRPVGEDRVGPLGLEELAERGVVRDVNDRFAVRPARRRAGAPRGFRRPWRPRRCASRPRLRLPPGHSPSLRYRRTTSWPRSA